MACEQNRHQVDLSGVEVELAFKHFHKDLFVEVEDWQRHSSSLSARYGEFYYNFCSLIPGLGDPNDLTHPVYLKAFVENADIRGLEKEIETRIPHTADFDIALNQAFSYYKYHFPEKEIPEIIYFNSALNVTPVVNEGQMGIALDMFLGQDFELYRTVGIPQYLYRRMSQEYIVTNSMRGWLISEFPRGKTENLLEDIIWEGKILYAMDAMFPFTHDSLKIEFTQQGLDWCDAFESNIWAHLVEGDLLYTSDMTKRLPYLNEGPFTSGFAKESPARVGKWLGWQIVSAFMEKKNIPLSELMQTNATELLRASNYKPRK